MPLLIYYFIIKLKMLDLKNVDHKLLYTKLIYLPALGTDLLRKLKIACYECIQDFINGCYGRTEHFYFLQFELREISGLFF